MDRAADPHIHSEPEYPYHCTHCGKRIQTFRYRNQLLGFVDREGSARCVVVAGGDVIGYGKHHEPVGQAEGLSGE